MACRLVNKMNNPYKVNHIGRQKISSSTAELPKKPDQGRQRGAGERKSDSA